MENVITTCLKSHDIGGRIQNCSFSHKPDYLNNGLSIFDSLKGLTLKPSLNPFKSPIELYLSIEDEVRESSLLACYFSNLDYIVNVSHTINEKITKLKSESPYCYELAFDSIHKNKYNSKEIINLSDHEKYLFKMLCNNLDRAKGVIFNQRLFRIMFELYEQLKFEKKDFSEYISFLQTSVNIQNETSFKKGFLLCGECGDKTWQNYYSKYKFSYFTRQKKCKEYSSKLRSAFNYLLEIQNNYDYFLLTLAPQNILKTPGSTLTGEDLESIGRIYDNFFRDRQVKKIIKGYFGVPEVKYHPAGSISHGRTRATGEFNLHGHFVALCPKNSLEFSPVRKKIKKLFIEKFHHFCKLENNPKFVNSHKGVDIDFRSSGNSNNATRYILKYLSKGFDVNDDDALKDVHLAFKNKKLYFLGGELRTSKLNSYVLLNNLSLAIDDSINNFFGLPEIQNSYDESRYLPYSIYTSSPSEFFSSYIIATPKIRYNRLYSYYSKLLKNKSLIRNSVKQNSMLRKSFKSNLSRSFNSQLHRKKSYCRELFNFFDFKLTCSSCESIHLICDNYHLYTDEQIKELTPVQVETNDPFYYDVFDLSDSF